MPAARGVKRTASKSSTSTASTAPKNKKKRNVVQLEVPTLPKRRGRVLTCGQGDVGQLGLGEDVIETTRFKHVTGLGEKIVDVCAGGMHTIAIDSDGKVWTFGCNDEGALGRVTSGDGEEGAAAPVALPSKAVAISAGDSHSAALLCNGDVYAWGAFRDSHGSMGLVVRGREGKPCRDPVKVDIPEPAAEIASGSDHLVILTTSGSVYTMGCGEQGQLGRLSQRSATRDTRQGFSALLVPSKVTLKMGASRVWAGYHATLALDSSASRVYAWGLNNYGQLGITGEKRKTALFSPTAADGFQALGCGWSLVACGQHHSLALDDKGRVYAVGRCEYGRLGLGAGAGDAEALEPIPALLSKKVVSIAAGTCNSFAVTDAGEVLAWGMGSEGQLGTGGCADAPAPTPAAPAAALQGRRARHVSAGGQHTVLLAEDPNAINEDSPEPELEMEDQTEDVEEEEPEPVPVKKAKGRATKRANKQEQEEEVSSTSSAAPAPPVAGEAAPQKVNGDEKKETPMEVDQTDSKQENEETQEKEKETTDTTQPTTDTDSSQDAPPTVPSEAQDVEMTPDEKQPEPEKPEEQKAEVNGTPEEKKEVEIEAKTVENVQETAVTVSTA